MTSPLWVCLSPDDRAALDRICDDYASVEDVAKVKAALAKYDAALDERFVDAARHLEFIRDGECEIDDSAVVSHSEDGAYVMAWVWVDRTQVEPDYVPSYLRG